MVYRFSWIAGLAAIGLAFWELTSVMRPSAVGTPWQVVVLLAVLLGAGITWSVIAYRAPGWIVIVSNVGAFVIFAGLVVAPDTLFLIFPTGETWNALIGELGRAFEIIQRSVEPVRPVPGLVLLIALLFWVLGFLLTAGLLNDRPFVAILTPIVAAVQFAIVDRKPKNMAHLAIFILVVVFCLVAIRSDERDQGTGKLQRVNGSGKPSNRPTPAIGLLIAATAAAGLIAVGLIGNAVPGDGFVSWRSPSGFSDGYSGSSSYNPFVDIKAGLISVTDNPLFQADITGVGVDPASVRFRTVTLDVYKDGRWSTNEIFSYPIEDGDWIDPEHAYRGETDTAVVRIQIQNLSQPWMPAPVTPTSAYAATEGDTRTMEVRRLDGSIILRGDVTYSGMEYTVESEIPRYTPSLLASVALTDSGELSPLFRAAQDAGRSIPPASEGPEARTLENSDFWTDIPEDLGSGVLREAQAQTKGLTTNFEIALALEYYFRSSGTFVYNTEVPGEWTTSDVSAWLTDSDNPFVRNGYCEQFATAMALMGRSLGIPSRVVLGFTSGEAFNDTVVQVRDKNAHAWVEIWIPRYGWMAFDPTPRSGYAAVTVNDRLTELLDFSPYEYIEAIPAVEIVDDSGGDVGPGAGPLTPREEREPGFVAAGGGTTSDSAGIALPDWTPWAIGLSALTLFIIAMTPTLKWLKRRRRLAKLRSGDISSAWDDITERLTDLGDPFEQGATPIEAAEGVDVALVPLATTYGQSLYGERESTTLVIDQAVEAHSQAVDHLTTRYSTGERLVAVMRPTRLLRRLAVPSQRRGPKKDSA